ncbi:MAG: PQQ-binding-like beta-propeller repeat protein, partial [Pseudomonadales bacterium]|nr:PQQ-binding-like beta-propeller repeat protein [Pseudomonadales bacterium]
IGPMLYVVSYQGNLLAIDLSANGRIRWGREASSAVGLAAGFGNVYVVYDDSRIGAIDLESNKDQWEIDDFTYRYLTTPAVVGSYLAVGDFEGYLHLVAQSDGRIVGRRKIDGEGLTAPFVTDGNRIYLISDGGRLMALEVQ